MDFLAILTPLGKILRDPQNFYPSIYHLYIPRTNDRKCYWALRMTSGSDYNSTNVGNLAKNAKWQIMANFLHKWEILCTGCPKCTVDVNHVIDACF